ncbi:MAG: PhoH family protein [Planctomycetota bacterium]|nr:PhoH family protein [Planctomycetota bacterium]MCX8040484.1 PhoH family protein [Planctomycetota bacterium]MDW8372307.1 PhoH family protein [Planctomycetota bacterium]
MSPASRPKTFVIDTNVLLHNPASLFAFADNRVVIPMVVLEELDKFKTANNELGQNSREVVRTLDRLRAQGSLREGVPTPQGGIIQVVMDGAHIDGLLPGVNDNRILGCAHHLRSQGHHVIFVSKDINARVKADALGIPSEDFKAMRVNIDALYSGFVAVEVEAAQLAECAARAQPPAAIVPAEDLPLAWNQFVVLRDRAQPERWRLLRYDGHSGLLHPVPEKAPEIYGVSPRSPEQRMAFELLLDDRVKLVTLVGRAGTGKTLLALACGLSKVIDSERYTKMLVSRPIMPLGADIGYLPGSKDDKLTHWMGPIFDNLHFLLASEERDPDDVIKRLLAEETITLEALTYIRGRSIARQFVVVDEAQNLTPHEIKTIISRAGEDTKVVLTGDPHQIDNPYLDANSNGLTHVVERLRGQRLAGHVTFTKSERSELAGVAADML